ncbi:MAG: type I DNA topoisomerase [Sulfuricurvum sp.]|uniref:type I DNA topoisomerase n=1 Tax=Sulfuricurvum sp. TaxID=2025608 RepID=UPI0026138CDB|nr:type I DNA topoisomerase [Sulfuricurvum sp.]MDD2828673.1 type I DNA topoisomerase [Sulfuricurvum sp.]MDD4949251.1 type I DNA topoisomerase [Sulfuricurvum sp.]
MKLIIVESPAKAKTIKNFLTNDYEVIASKGHIRDLPKARFGIKIDNETITPEYKISEDSTATVKQIQELAKKSETIYLATDEDREGEAIGWHIAHAIGKDPESLPRIVFHEITKNAIMHALESPRTINMDRVNAQQARRLLDRIVGYKLSPLLASKIQKGLSAGRVQSSTLKIVVDREREIRAFIPEEYWSIDTLFKTDIDATLIQFENEKIEKLTIKTGDNAKKIVETLKAESFTVGEIETKERKSSTPPPFMTSTLQQAASSSLSFSPKKTMMVAQALYEGVKTPEGVSGVITYMRTDSLNLATEAVDAARELILNRYGKAYLPENPKVYTKKSKGAQEAHEAIRPTMLSFTPEVAATYLKPDEIKLYRLIYNRFIACQMNDARFEQQSITFESEKAEFRATGRKLLFDGFYRVTGSDDKDKLLPTLTTGQKIDIQTISTEQHFTEPPSRYSEASLIKKLESEGIGRPSTYAPTVSTLQARNYIDIEKRAIIPTEIAFTVTEMLEKHFNEIVDANFTATMEETLDEIGEEGKSWQKILLDFYHPFMAKVDAGKTDIVSLKMAKPLGRNCPQCGSELLLRSGRFGEFIACSGFPKCKYTEQTEENQKAAPTTADEASEEVCDKCGSAMVIKNGRNGQFLACSGYPTCKNTKTLNQETKFSEVPCPDCGGKLQWRQSRRGAFWGCEHYPKCKFISKFEPSDKKCEVVGCGGALAPRTYRNKEVYECVKCKDRTPREESGE